MLLVRGDHMGNEVKIGKLPGIGRLALGDRRGDRRGDRLQARLPRPGRHARRRAADRRSQRRRDERFRLRRERDGLPPARRQLRPRLRASRTWSPTFATSSRATRRPTARARSRSCAASRSATCSRSAHVYSEDMGATYLDANGQSQVRSRWAATASASRGSSRRRSSRTTTRKGIVWPERDGPLHGGDRAVGYDRNEAVRGAADRLHDELDGGRASRCCWTTAASALA